MELKKVELRDGIFFIENFFNEEECDALIRSYEDKGFEEAKINTRFGEQDIKDVRNNERIIFDDYDLAKNLFNKLNPFLPPEIDSWQPSGLNEKFRFYRYKDQQYFKWHIDGSFKRDYFEVSKLTVLFYLNENYKGGETEFEEVRVSPRKGMALIFPHRLRHQGVALSEGTKYVLRSDIMYAKA